MKVGIISDLHAEHWRSDNRVGETVREHLAAADIILMAGDIAKGAQAVSVAQTLFPNKPVFMVAGNHEFYDGDYHEVIAALREAASASPNVKFLHQDVAVIPFNGITLRIIGTTLWTDFDLHGNVPLALLDAYGINDFRLIGYQRRALKPEDTLAWHQEQRRWIVDMLNADLGDALNILLTHHAPVSFAIAPRFVGDNLSPCFASRLEAILLNDDLNLVVWGHTHHCVDRQIASTRFVSNQTGYALRRGTETGMYGCVIELP